MLDPKSYEELNEYKLYNKADMIDLTRITLNEYAIDDNRYNQIIRIMVSGRKDIYSSDLVSCVHEYAQMLDTEFQEFYGEFIVKRRQVWYNRNTFWSIANRRN